jgi:hypothetical protein
MSESSYGLWWAPAVPDRKVAGHLTYEPLRAPQLSLLDAPPQIWAGPDLQPDESYQIGDMGIPILHGRLADQGEVTLLDCRWSGLSVGVTATHTMRVGRAVIGVLLDKPDQKFVRRIEIDLPALEILLGKYPIRPIKWPNRRSRSVQLTLDNHRCSWDDSTTQIAWEYQWSVSVGDVSTNISMAPMMILTSGKPRSLDKWIGEWVSPVNDLLEVMTGARSNPRSISVWIKKHLTPDERSATMMPIWQQGVGSHEHDLGRYEVLANAKAVDNNPLGLHDVVVRFRRLAVDQAVFLSLLGGAIRYPDRPSQNRYLDLTSALEAYHSNLHGKGPITPETFQERRESIIAATNAAGLGSSDVRFMKRWLARWSYFSLEQRLERLARDTGVLSNWSVRTTRMAYLRNDIAHGNAYVDARELRTAHDQAFDLARRLVLQELGMTGPPEPVNQSCVLG